MPQNHVLLSTPVDIKNYFDLEIGFNGVFRNTNIAIKIRTMYLEIPQYIILQYNIKGLHVNFYDKNKLHGFFDLLTLNIILGELSELVTRRTSRVHRKTFSRCSCSPYLKTPLNPISRSKGKFENFAKIYV